MARGTPRTYQLCGLLHCGLCQRKMQGNWNHDSPYYRWRFPNEYGLANSVEHPRTVYLREKDVVPALDRWLLKIFEPANVEHTLDQLVAAQPDTDADAMAANRLAAECDRKLARYRAALEAGTDPAVVAEWVKQVQAEGAVAEARARSGPGQRMSREEIQYIVATLTNLATTIQDADPRDKAADEPPAERVAAAFTELCMAI